MFQMHETTRGPTDQSLYLSRPTLANDQVCTEAQAGEIPRRTLKLLPLRSRARLTWPLPVGRAIVPDLTAFTEPQPISSNPLQVQVPPTITVESLLQSRHSRCCQLDRNKAANLLRQAQQQQRLWRSNDTDVQV